MHHIIKQPIRVHTFYESIFKQTKIRAEHFAEISYAHFQFTVQNISWYKAAK